MLKGGACISARPLQRLRVTCEDEFNLRAGPFGTYYAKALMFRLEHYKFVIGLATETWKLQVQEALD